MHLLRSASLIAAAHEASFVAGQPELPQTTALRAGSIVLRLLEPPLDVWENAAFCHLPGGCARGSRWHRSCRQGWHLWYELETRILDVFRMSTELLAGPHVDDEDVHFFVLSHCAAQAFIFLKQGWPMETDAVGLPEQPYASVADAAAAVAQEYLAPVLRWATQSPSAPKPLQRGELRRGLFALTLDGGRSEFHAIADLLAGWTVMSFSGQMHYASRHGYYTRPSMAPKAAGLAGTLQEAEAEVRAFRDGLCGALGLDAAGLCFEDTPPLLPVDAAEDHAYDRRSPEHAQGSIVRCAFAAARQFSTNHPGIAARHYAEPQDLCLPWPAQGPEGEPHPQALPAAQLQNATCSFVTRATVSSHSRYSLRWHSSWAKKIQKAKAA
eukprot:TRINITY_DN36196_c0_g1_i1.p1 TRINITY_DN36196_c0_g1~~TRINITY_DN36196_c0_g1_i1.p1  ORF type:complete len:382 (+),score=65.59 TRINITY_DN36196_c0_g1_i1:166-1311(+)